MIRKDVKVTSAVAGFNRIYKKQKKEDCIVDLNKYKEMYMLLLIYRVIYRAKIEWQQEIFMTIVHVEMMWIVKWNVII